MGLLSNFGRRQYNDFFRHDTICCEHAVDGGILLVLHYRCDVLGCHIRTPCPLERLRSRLELARLYHTRDFAGQNQEQYSRTLLQGDEQCEVKDKFSFESMGNCTAPFHLNSYLYSISSLKYKCSHCWSVDRSVPLFLSF